MEYTEMVLSQFIGAFSVTVQNKMDLLQDYTKKEDIKNLSNEVLKNVKEIQNLLFIFKEKYK